MINRTKAGRQMQPVTRMRIVEILSNPHYDEMTQPKLAAHLGIGERTLRDYLTPEVWEDIRKQRMHLMHQSLALVDRAIFNKACQGDIQAAKFIYGRWDVVKDHLPTFNTPQELDEAIASVEQRITNLERTDDLETAQAAPADAEAPDDGAEPTGPLHPKP